MKNEHTENLINFPLSQFEIELIERYRKICRLDAVAGGSAIPGEGDRLGWLLERVQSDARLPPAQVTAQYTDAERYRLVVAAALDAGAVFSKGAFDAQVGLLGTLNAADELIAFRNLRPGCKAFRHGKNMTCECGLTWNAGDANPPHCRDPNYR